MFVYILLIIGFILLIKGAEFLVDGATSIAQRFKISSLVIGLTIVAFGTSAPELVLNIIASIQGAADMAIGNIIGSNISNILLIGGVAAMVYPLRVKKSTTWRDIPISLLAMIILFVLANDFLLERFSPSIIGRVDGAILLSFFLIFLYYTFGYSKTKEEDNTKYKSHSTLFSVSCILIGMAGLTIGGKLIIDGATEIAATFGLSDALIGLTVLAVGTSLPELATSVVAAFKKNADLAIGNIVGSNIFNVFMVLGVSALIRPMPFNMALGADLLIGMGATLLLYYFIFVGKQPRHVVRWEGAGLFIAYLCYISFVVWRG